MTTYTIEYCNPLHGYNYFPFRSADTLNIEFLSLSAARSTALRIFDCYRIKDSHGDIVYWTARDSGVSK